MPQTELRVPGMDCEHCEQSIIDILKELEGVNDIATDIDARRLSFSFDPRKTSLEAVRGRLSDQGFPPED